MVQDEECRLDLEELITPITNIEYILWNNNINLCAACLLSNVIVKEINKISDNEVKILYGSEDSRPMYISYRGFRTEEEAKEEYINSLTVMGHININNVGV